MAATQEELSYCPGLGPQKATRLHKVLQQPFQKHKTQTKRDTQQPKQTTASGASSAPPQGGAGGADSDATDKQ